MSLTPSEYEFLRGDMEKGLPRDNPRSAVMRALGAASMCWEPKPTGEFDSDACIIIGEALLAALGFSAEGTP